MTDKAPHTELDALTDEMNDAISDLEERLGAFRVPAVIPFPGRAGSTLELRRRNKGWVLLVVDDAGGSCHLLSTSRETRVQAVTVLDKITEEVMRVHAAEMARVKNATSKVDALIDSTDEELKKREI